MINFKIYSTILLILSISCNNKLIKYGSNSNNPLENGLWITDRRDLPTNDSLFYLDLPAPIFRKEFLSKNKIKKANLFITAAGYYKASLNGNPIGKNELDPAWTDYNKRIYYSEYDVTTMVVNGSNSLAVMLGNGFYNPLPLRKWGRRNLREDLTVGKPTFIANLNIQYQNGNSVHIVTDSSWKYNYGPIIKNDIYLGVTYDAAKQLDDWDKPGYDDKHWLSAIRTKGPGGKLQPSFFPPVQITKEITPIHIYAASSDVYMVDMGINFTGTYKIKLSGTKGDTIRFRFGERIYQDSTLNPMTVVAGQIKRKGVGGPGAPAIAWQTDSYIIGDNKEDWFAPDFTYHTFRYIEIRGLKYKPSIADIKGLFIHTNVEDNNSFTCSSPLLNAIQDATKRTFLANLVSVQSDCAAREKFGYGGDLNATSESFIYNFDMQAFYRKTIYDWIDAMKDSSFVDTAPFVGIEYCGISWESAFITTQYYLYLYYHDTAIIHELYEMDKKWMDKAAMIHPQLLVNAGLSDHESLVPVPVQLIGTSHYLQCAQIMQTFAKQMQDVESELKYATLSEKLKKILLNEYWYKPVQGNINKQTLFATLLYHGVIPPQDIDAAKDSLLYAVKSAPAGHFNTGIFGTKYVLEVLSAYATPDEVFSIVNSTAYPGWGHMIDKGATTIWETWKESDNTYSNCHPMFGTVTEWFYRWLGGIRPEPASPGFNEFIINPSTPDGLEFVNSSYHTPYGKIVSNWKRLNEKNIKFDIVIPSKSKAKITLPIRIGQNFSIELKDLKRNKYEKNLSNRFELGEGEYDILIITE